MRVLDRLEEILISLLIAVATLVIFVAVVHRYGITMAVGLANWSKAQGLDAVFAAARAVFNWLRGIDLTWAQELCIYLFVWMAKFGAAYGVRTGIHVGVDVLINRLAPAHRKKVIVFGLLCGALFTGIVGTLGANFVLHMYHGGQISNDLEVPMWIVYLCVPIGSYLMCFRFLQVAVQFARTGELPHHDHAHVEGVEIAPDGAAPAPAPAAGGR